MEMQPIPTIPLQFFYSAFHDSDGNIFVASHNYSSDAASSRIKESYT
jgi:hypothetical protein